MRTFLSVVEVEELVIIFSITHTCIFWHDGQTQTLRIERHRETAKIDNKRT